ncbi:FRG domain-containing protein [Dysgonomonas sp. Marseille-P4677]|uniref:FRG domain-containing protein n=1 Tax=Dysgonomonas sp. Marseille-P4677 TaxID=2364790 RepID=UPI001914D0D0|nr:FRG domain-containing protein [Dysgonomonas sp. Marseille-P4677]MBK5723013.1 FRG domain-containing protein [Dysgonomonas sp. Marseille-P4677]
MRKITPDLTAELFDYFGNPRHERLGEKPAYRVETFRQLVELVAGLSFKNKDHLLFYRGQTSDYRNKAGVSSFYPTIYRGDYLSRKDLSERYRKLKAMGAMLASLAEIRKIEGYKEIKKRKYIQWSILQHYEVCPTPYLDFTHSLRVACSFATLNNTTNRAYIFIFGLPYLTNRISINSEHDIINIRLLSICPPTAFRPYFQEGYLVGTDGISDNYDVKGELDFNNRLIAKFEIPNDNSFWGKDFNGIPKNLLYPENDPMLDLCREVEELVTE